VGLLGASARTHEAWRARAALERRVRAAARKAGPGQAPAQPVQLPAAPQRCESPEVILNLADGGNTPIEEAQRIDAVERMQEAIGLLSPASASILCKRFGVLGEREHSTRELGEQMGVEPRVVNRLLMRAMEELRRFLSVPRVAAA
jgi:DNA-directed RNA polymerase sigma subunit (sigma70/sigma32)